MTLSTYISQKSTGRQWSVNSGRNFFDGVQYCSLLVFVPAGCGSLDNWSVIISAHELHEISVCNCDNRKLQQPRSRCSSKQREMSSQLWPAISEAIFCFSYVIFHYVSWKITCKYQACIASINMRESPSKNYIENQGTYFLITPFLSYLRSTKWYPLKSRFILLLEAPLFSSIRSNMDSISEYVNPQSPAKSLWNDRFLVILNALPREDRERGEIPVTNTFWIKPLEPKDLTVDQNDRNVRPTSVSPQLAICLSTVS